MDYQPDYAGRNLTLGEANMVGIVFPVTGETAPANPFHIDLMRGISTELQKRIMKCWWLLHLVKINY